MRTPKARIAARLARQSSLARKPLTSLDPSAMPESISARCEMDLSPGTVIAPETRVAGCASKPCHQSTARGYEPSTLNNDARCFERSQRLGDRRDR